MKTVPRELEMALGYGFANPELLLCALTHRSLVNERALDTDQGQKIVYVVGDDNKVSVRPVQLGALHDGLREITDGLKPGEQVIVNGLQQVRLGVTVKPRPVDMPVPLAAITRKSEKP